MNAQQIVDMAKDNDEEYMKLFYPELYNHQKAELNLIQCVRRIR